MSQTTPHLALQPEYRLLVLLVSIGFFMQALDTTIVNTAIPAMAAHLQEDPLNMHSVVVAYVLAVAACIPLSGWLADRFGYRDWETDRKSTRLNSSHLKLSRMPSSA